MCKWYEKLIYECQCRRDQKRWNDKDDVLQCTQILNVDETCKQQRFLTIIMSNFACMAAITHFRISGTSQANFGSFKCCI